MMLSDDFTLNEVSGKSHDEGNVSALAKSKMGRVGIEPTRPFGQGILSPRRLPIPPPPPRTQGAVYPNRGGKVMRNVRFCYERGRQLIDL